MNTPAPPNPDSEKNLAMVIYALYAASFVVGITAPAPAPAPAGGA